MIEAVLLNPPKGARKITQADLEALAGVSMRGSRARRNRMAKKPLPLLSVMPGTQNLSMRSYTSGRYIR